MKRWGTITLMLFAFIVGFTSTYNCGGGSSATAGGDADTLEGHPASYFAIASHTHTEYMDLLDTCSNGQVLKWDGSAWVCGDDLDSTDADTLDSYGSSDFALSSHSHSGISATQYVSVSMVAGVSGNQDRTTIKAQNFWDPINDEYGQFANADTSVWWEGRANVGPTNDNIYVPVQLPNGATIVEFGFVYYDESDDTITVNAALRQSVGYVTLVRIKPTGIANVPQYAWTTSISPTYALVNNTLNSYHIRCNISAPAVPFVPDVAVISAIVGYKLP
jgi:hypothetical protein